MRFTPAPRTSPKLPAAAAPRPRSAAGRGRCCPALPGPAPSETGHGSGGRRPTRSMTPQARQRRHCRAIPLGAAGLHYSPGLYLHAGLRVRGQEGLSRRLQELLPRGDEGPRGGGARLVEVQDPHGALGLHAGPHRPLPGVHRLLALLGEGGPGRAEGHRALRRNGMGAVQKRGRRRRRGTALLEQGVTREPRICRNERIKSITTFPGHKHTSET